MNAPPTVTREPAVPRPWQQHGRETLLDTRSYLIHRDTVTQPDGTRAAFEFHQAQLDGALTVAMDDQGRIAMVRYRSYVHGEVLTPPGGNLDPGEDPLEGAQRELKEESGITATVWSPLGRIALMTKSTAHLHIFLARDLTVGEQELTATETGMTVEWWPLEDAVAAAMDGRLLLSGAVVSVLMAAQATGAADRLHLVPSADAAPQAPDRQVREFAEQAVGRITGWTDASWAREGSRVWRAQGAEGGEWFVKIHQSVRFHDREVEAYRSWVPTLGPAAPRLVAADPQLRAIVITAVPGRSLHGAVHPPEEQQQIFHRIGELAAAIHHSRPAQPANGAPAAFGKLERHLAVARAHLAPGDEDFIRQVTAKADRLPDLEVVPTHGDFQLRNLRWDQATGTLYVIDFERSERGPALRDFVRLSDAWSGRPDLRAAVMAGYGRHLSQTEEEHVAVHQVLDAVSGIQFGISHGDPELVERGRRALAQLRATRGSGLPPAGPEASR